MTALNFERLRQLRAEDPGRFASALSSRARRPLLSGDGKLFIVAADHPARGALGVGSQPMAMANRYELLERLAIALSRPGVDGVLATADILDDLAVLGLLEGKIAVGSINRGGLRGAAFELDDRVTAFGLESLKERGIDFAKVLLRIDLSDPGTLGTLEMTARAVDAAAALRMPIMIEPFMSHRVNGRVTNDLSPDKVIHSIAIASGLGSTSAWTWLKLPAVEEMDRVLNATTLPTLILGGDPSGSQEESYASWKKCLSLPGVRGLVIGRALLYPKDADVASAVDTAAALVHSAC
ncbi:MAG: deoxyribose-phosphate aldolase [Cryobacterium sp.]|nr:deoxyribose-phosphate aldolase [Cryobacterium sp.]